MRALLIALLTTIAPKALAIDEAHILLGLRMDRAACHDQTPGFCASQEATQKDTAGYGAGLAYLAGEEISLRTGLLLNQRNYQLTGTNQILGSSLLTLDIPLQFDYEIQPHWHAFIGPAIGINLQQKCHGDPCELKNARLVITPLQVGTSYRFYENWGFELFYETDPTSYDSSIRAEQGWVLSLLYKM